MRKKAKSGATTHDRNLAYDALAERLRAAIEPFWRAADRPNGAGDDTIRATGPADGRHPTVTLDACSPDMARDVRLVPLVQQVLADFKDGTVYVDGMIADENGGKRSFGMDLTVAHAKRWGIRPA